MTSRKWAYEDFAGGASIEIGPKKVTAEEIIAFASEFDAQPMHLDEAAGKASLLGGLAASGWHSCAMFMRMICDAFLLDSTSQGSPGIEEVRWRAPVLAGDTLSGRCMAVSSRLSKSRPGLGLVSMRTELFNQHGRMVLEVKNSAMFLTREAAQ
jgi:acyl dehydratase